jgi:hypothetical protein
LIGNKETGRGICEIPGMRYSVRPAGLIILLALICGGCASDVSVGRTAESVGSALHQPLDDLNIDAAEIPSTLVRVRSAPYALPQMPSCESIGAEIHELDKVLGPDLDAPVDEKADTDKSRSAMMDNMAHSAASSWIPFRGAVRWVTGAERHTRKLNEAVLAGAIRRGYLKGVSGQMACAKAAPPVIAQPVSSAPILK